MEYALKPLSLSEIPYVIRDASPFGGKIEASFDFFTSLRIVEMTCDSRGFVFMKLAQKLTEKVPLFVKLNYRNLMFKIFPEQYSIEGDVLVTSIPQAAKALDRRPDERFVMPLNSEILCHMNRIEKRGISFEDNARIIDVSEKGLGILITNASSELILAHDHVWIKKLNKFELEEPLFGRIVYSNERKYKDGIIDIKAGISLNAPIPRAAMLHLRCFSHLVLPS